MDVSTHILVPKHVKLSEEEKKELLEEYNISLKQLPKITKSDPAIEHMETETGDVIKIIRKSPARGEINYYRVVINA